MVQIAHVWLVCLTVKDSFMAIHAVNTPIDSMWNDVMTELESAADEFGPQKIARLKERVPHKLKKQQRKQKKLFDKQKGSSKFSRASQHYKAHKGFVQRIRKTHQEYWSYINSIIYQNDDEAIQESNQRFWRFIKHKKSDTQGGCTTKM